MMMLGALITVLTLILLLLLAFIIYTGCGYADYYSYECEECGEVHCEDGAPCEDGPLCKDATPCMGGGDGAQANDKPCYSTAAVERAERDVRNMIYSNKWFGPDRKEELDQYNIMAARGGIKDIRTLSIMRRMEIGQLSKISCHKAPRMASEISTLWRKSDASPGALLAISKTLFLPPLAVARELQRVGINPGSAVLKAAARADLGSAENNHVIQSEATRFEGKVEKKLRKVGLKFLTEKQQREAGTNTSATPDFLMTAPIFYNGHQINWIDAKNFLGWESDLVYSKLKKQAKKYNTAFGHGAFIFSEGYVCGFDVGADVLCMHDVKNFYTSSLAN